MKKSDKNGEKSKMSLLFAKSHPGSWMYKLLRLFFLVSVSYVVLYPLFYMISNALKPENQLLDPSVVWVPKGVSWSNFKIAAEALKMPQSFWMSLLVQVASGGIQVFTCAYIAYGFARFDFKERKLLLGLVMVTLIVPSQMIMVPLYMNYRNLDFLGILGLLGQAFGIELRPNILNSPASFYFPSVFGVGVRSGLFIYIYRQFFQTLPKELEEAAWIDGAGPIKTFFRIALPSSGVAVLTVSIFSVIWHWNEYYLSAMFYFEKFPMSVALAQIDTALAAMGYGTKIVTGISMAACLLFVLPMLIMYIFLQKYFIKSIDKVGIVG